VTDLNLIFAEQEQDSLQIRGESGYVPKLSNTLDMQGHGITGLPARPQSDTDATSFRYTKSGDLLFSQSDTFITSRRIRHATAREDHDSLTLAHARNLIAEQNLSSVPFVTMALSSLLTQERVLTGSSTITVTDGGPGTTATLTIPTTFIISGTFTPTLFNVTNVAASTAYLCSYVRIGSVVIFSGKVDVDPTAAASTILDLSLPIASAFTQEEDLGGAAFATAVAGQGAALHANATDDRARMRWITVDVANRSMFFICLYRLM
jgi:hypothetical protein